MLQKVVISAVLALCFFGICDAIRCYECQSTVDEYNCGEKFRDNNQVKQVDCNLKPRPPGFEFAGVPTRCSKSVLDDGRGKVVIRGCHFQLSGQNSQCTLEPSHPIPKICESCTGDLCNSATTPIVAVSTLFLVLTSAFFMS